MTMEKIPTDKESWWIYNHKKPVREGPVFCDLLQISDTLIQHLLCQCYHVIEGLYFIAIIFVQHQIPFILDHGK